MTATQSKKIVVVDGVAGGASAAARIKRLDETADVVVFEKGGDVSFSNCSLPYYLSGTVEDSEDLIMMTSAAFRKKHDIDVRVHAEVLSINSWAFLDLSQFNSVVDAFARFAATMIKSRRISTSSSSGFIVLFSDSYILCHLP